MVPNLAVPSVSRSGFQCRQAAEQRHLVENAGAGVPAASERRCHVGAVPVWAASGSG